MDYFKTLFISLCPQFPEPSRESLLRWSIFEISVVEAAIRTAALKFADTEPDDIYRFITLTARNRFLGKRTRERFLREFGKMRDQEALDTLGIEALTKIRVDQGLPQPDPVTGGDMEVKP
jgi:hypothetical protein